MPFAFSSVCIYANRMATPKIKVPIGGLPWFTSREELALFDGLDLSCVYAVGPRDIGRPVNVGSTSSALKRFTELQMGNPSPLMLYDIAWVAGPPLARRLEEAVHTELARKGSRLHGNWFDVSDADAVSGFQAAIDREKIRTMTQAGLLEQIQLEHQRRTDAIVNRALGGRNAAA